MSSPLLPCPRTSTCTEKQPGGALGGSSMMSPDAARCKRCLEICNFYSSDLDNGSAVATDHVRAYSLNRGLMSTAHSTKNRCSEWIVGNSHGGCRPAKL